MVNKILKIAPLLLLTMMMVGCEINSSDNGDLDNWWYLREVEQVNDNGTRSDEPQANSGNDSENYIEKKVFWSYIGNLMHTEGASAGRYFYRFEQKGGTLRIYEPRHNNKSKGDPLLTETELTKLNAHGIHMKAATDSDGNILTDSDGNTIYEETFTVEQLNSESMVLLNEDKTLRLHFIAW